MIVLLLLNLSFEPIIFSIISETNKQFSENLNATEFPLRMFGINIFNPVQTGKLKGTNLSIIPNGSYYVLI